MSRRQLSSRRCPVRDLTWFRLPIRVVAARVNCVLCAQRNRTRELTEGHVCPACRNGLRVDLGQILDLVALAATMPDPFASRTSTGGGRPHPGSRPPIDLSHVGPHLALIRLERDDPSSDTPLLVVLEDWCRIVREDRGLAPYGPATAARTALLAPNPHGVVLGDHATLQGVCGFLRASADWMCDDPTFGLEQFRDNLSRILATLRALDPTCERHDGWGIPFPADIVEDDGLEPDACGRRLRIERHDDGRLDLHGDIHCPDCGTAWTAQRLLLVALADERVPLWGYPDDVATLTGVTPRTLRRWAEVGTIARQGGQYDAGAAFRYRHAREA